MSAQVCVCLRQKMNLTADKTLSALSTNVPKSAQIIVDTLHTMVYIVRTNINEVLVL